MNRTEVGEGRFSRDRTRTKVPKCQDGALEHSQEGNVGSSQPLEGVDTSPPSQDHSRPDALPTPAPKQCLAQLLVIHCLRLAHSHRFYDRVVS